MGERALGRTSGTKRARQCLGLGFRVCVRVHICTLKSNETEIMALILHVFECYTSVYMSVML
jgi:hypothetical protein